MNNDWTEISVNTTTIVGELISEFLLEEGAKGIVLGEWKPNDVSEYTVVKAYLPEEFDIKEISQKIQDKLNLYAESGLNVGAREILVKTVKEDDWSDSWKKYFHVTHVGKHLVIKPLWEDYQAQKEDLVINFDPGMAFGTGTHPSTHLCLEKIEEIFTNNNSDYNTLDLGTGSGVLAITMDLLGVKKNNCC